MSIHDLLYERQDGLYIAVACLLTYESEGSSVNFRARQALNAIRDLGEDNARLIEECKLERCRETATSKETPDHNHGTDCCCAGCNIG